MPLKKLLMDQYDLDEWVADELANASPERLRELVEAADRPVSPPKPETTFIKISDQEETGKH